MNGPKVFMDVSRWSTACVVFRGGRSQWVDEDFVTFRSVRMMVLADFGGISPT